MVHGQLTQRPRRAEIGDPGVRGVGRPVEQHVLGLEVLVHQASRVELGEGGEHLIEHGQRHPHRRLSPQQVAQASLVGVGQRHERPPVGQPPVIEHRHDVGVPHRRRDGHLARKPRPKTGVNGQVRVDDLEGDRRAQRVVVGLPDRPGGTLAHHAEGGVARREPGGCRHAASLPLGRPRRARGRPGLRPRASPGHPASR